MIYLLLYKDATEFAAAESGTPGDGVVSIVPGVSLTEDVEVVDYNPLPAKALIFVNNTNTDGTVTLTAVGAPPKVALDYSNDNTVYSTISSNDTPAAGDKLTFQLPAGGKLYLKGENTRFATAVGNRWSFNASVSYHLEGDIMAIVADETEMTQPYEFAGLFHSSDKITTVEDGVLSAPVVSNSGYHSMFYSASLTQMPSLTANTLGDSAYAQMFRNASFKTVGPLPAMNLGKNCYDNMFRWAVNLTGMPTSLPAMVLADSCYASMFLNCTKLTKAPEIMAENAYPVCFASMFNTCTALVTPPVMHIKRLEGAGDDTHADMCCQYMFDGCRSLTGTPDFFQNITGSVVTWRAFQYMFRGCTSLTYACDLPATGGTPYCYCQMFAGCTSLVNAPVIGLTDIGYGITGRTSGLQCQGMFMGCTSLTTAPVLKANLLKFHCYESMFSGCTSLNYVKAMFTETYPTESALTPTDATYQYVTDWLSGVAPTGTFVKHPNATWTNAEMGIPSGWTVQTSTS